MSDVEYLFTYLLAICKSEKMSISDIVEKSLEVSLKTKNRTAVCSTNLTSGYISSVQFSSVAQSCPTLRDPVNRRTPGLPVHHQLPEFYIAKGNKVTALKRCLCLTPSSLQHYSQQPRLRNNVSNNESMDKENDKYHYMRITVTVCCAQLYIME